jgi:hypothetical protein
VPFVRPLTVQVVAPVVVQVLAPGLDVTVYPVIGDPPLSGAVQDTVEEAFCPLVAVTPVGGAGAPAGVAGLEAAEDGPVPTGLVAVTVNV